VVPEDDSIGKKPERFVPVTAFFAMNRTDQHHQQQGVLQQSFARCKDLMKSVAPLTLKFRKFHDLTRRRPRATKQY